MERRIENLVVDLKAQYNLSNYEALDIACKIEQNNLLRRAFVLSEQDNYPTALEAVAIALGYEQ